MRKIKSGKVALKDLKFLENSRLRGVDDVSDLMKDIEQRGLLQGIGVRLEDNALIYGNRRVKAFEKLGYEEIPCDFYTDVTDEMLLVMNLVENIKRRNIGSVEIGRVVEILLNKNLTNSEIAEKLGISKDRVQGCLSAYRITKGTPFEKLVGLHRGNAAGGGIPEGILWKIQTSLTKARKLTNEDWNLLLVEIEKGNFTTHHIANLRKVLLANKTLTVKQGLEILEKCYVAHVTLCFDVEELNKALSKEKETSAQELIKEVIKKYDDKLIF